MQEKTFTITAETGVHARPATLLVNKAGQFESDIELEYNGKKVNLKSVMGVMSLGVPKDGVVKITVDGSDEDKAIESLNEVMNEYLAK